MKDIGIWSSSTELQVELQAGACVQRLGGVARVLAREIPPNVLRNGRQEVGAGGNAFARSGLEIVLRGLQKRFGAQDSE